MFILADPGLNPARRKECAEDEGWAEIRRLRFSERMGIKAIARQLGVSKNTVRHAVRSTAPPRYQREPKPTVGTPWKDGSGNS